MHVRRGRDSIGPFSANSARTFIYVLTYDGTKSSRASLTSCSSTIFYCLVTHFEGSLRATGTICKSSQSRNPGWALRQPIRVHAFHHGYAAFATCSDANRPMHFAINARISTGDDRSDGSLAGVATVLPTFA